MSLLIAFIKRYLMTPVGVIVTITHQLASTKCLSHLCCLSPTRVFTTPIGIIGMCSNAYRCVSPTRVKYPPVCYRIYTYCPALAGACNSVLSTIPHHITVFTPKYTRVRYRLCTSWSCFQDHNTPYFISSSRRSRNVMLLFNSTKYYLKFW
jgi:hypothetical protein